MRFRVRLRIVRRTSSQVLTSLERCGLARSLNGSEADPLPNGDAKRYQLRQLLALVDTYDLSREESPCLGLGQPAYPRIHRWSVELLAALAAGDPKILVGRQGPPQPSRVEAR